MRILMSAITWFDGEPGGLSRYFSEVARELAGAGHQVTALVLGEAPGEAFPGGLGLLKVPGKNLPARVLNFYRVLASELRGGGYDIYNPHFALYVFFPMLAGRLKDCPVVFNFQGPWAGEARVETAGEARPPSVRHRLACHLKKLIEGYVYRRCRRLVVLCGDNKKLLTEEYGVPPEKVTVLAGGCDTGRFAPGDRGEARRALGLPDQAKIIFTVRRLVRRMGIDLLIRSVGLLLQDHENLLLVVGGDGPLREELETLAGELGLSGRVVFTGFIAEKDLPLYYRAADVMALPSLAYEGFGLVTAEAMACGIPVVGTPVGATVEILSRLNPNLVAREVSPESLARTIKQVLSGEGWVPGPRQCRNFAVDNYSWARVSRDLLNVFQELEEPPCRIKAL